MEEITAETPWPEVHEIAALAKAKQYGNRMYVRDKSEAPEGAVLRRGPQGGLYYIVGEKSSPQAKPQEKEKPLNTDKPKDNQGNKMPKIEDVRGKIETAIKLTVENPERYKVRENISYSGRELKYGVFRGSELTLGITRDFYDKNKEEIEKIRVDAEKEGYERKIRDDWVTRTLSNNILRMATHGEDGSIYTLNAKVPSDVWAKIKDYVFYVSSEEDMEGYSDFGGDNFRGWGISNPKKVEEILHLIAEKQATDEHRNMAKRIEEERKESEEKTKRKKEKSEGRKKEIVEISHSFNNAERPDPKKEDLEYSKKFSPGYEKMRVDGELIENPLNPRNIYGGGQWWVIQDKWIWKVTNNGGDGDDWGANNVDTGGAGAIGVRIPYSKELADKIRKLKVEI